MAISFKGFREILNYGRPVYICGENIDLQAATFLSFKDIEQRNKSIRNFK